VAGIISEPKNCVVGVLIVPGLCGWNTGCPGTVWLEYWLNPGLCVEVRVVPGMYRWSIG